MTCGPGLIDAGNWLLWTGVWLVVVVIAEPAKICAVSQETRVTCTCVGVQDYYAHMKPCLNSLGPFWDFCKDTGT